MTAHDVKFTVPERPVGNADIEFQVKKGNEVFGRLLVSKGALVWVPKNRQHGFRVSWSDMDAFARQFGAPLGKKPGRRIA